MKIFEGGGGVTAHSFVFSIFKTTLKEVCSSLLIFTEFKACMRVSSQEVVAGPLPVLVPECRARDTSLPPWGITPLTYALVLCLILYVRHQLPAVTVCE